MGGINIVMNFAEYYLRKQCDASGQKSVKASRESVSGPIRGLYCGVAVLVKRAVSFTPGQPKLKFGKLKFRNLNFSKSWFRELEAQAERDSGQQRFSSQEQTVPHGDPTILVDRQVR